MQAIYYSCSVLPVNKGASDLSDKLACLVQDFKMCVLQLFFSYVSFIFRTVSTGTQTFVIKHFFPYFNLDCISFRNSTMTA